MQGHSRRLLAGALLTLGSLVAACGPAADQPEGEPLNSLANAVARREAAQTATQQAEPAGASVAPAGRAAASPAPGGLVNPQVDPAMVKGDPNAPVTLFDFSDFR